MPGHASISDTRADFIEKIGLIAQADGLPRIAGRVFGLLLFDGAQVSFSDLATQLQVSRGSISNSVRLLEERSLVKRVSKPGERQDYFQLAENPFVTMLEGIQRRSKATQAEITQTIDALPQGTPAITRLKDYADFFGATDGAIEIALTELRKTQTTNPGPTPIAPKEETNDVS